MSTVTTSTTQLITARLLRKLTAKTLARKAGISASYLSELEKTGGVPSKDVRTKIARVLQFDASELWPDAE